MFFFFLHIELLILTVKWIQLTLKCWISHRLTVTLTRSGIKHHLRAHFYSLAVTLTQFWLSCHPCPGPLWHTPLPLQTSLYGSSLCTHSYALQIYKNMNTVANLQAMPKSIWASIRWESLMLMRPISRWASVVLFFFVLNKALCH